MPGLKCDLLTFLRGKKGRTVRSESSLHSKCSLPSICLLDAHREGGKKMQNTVMFSRKQDTCQAPLMSHKKKKKEKVEGRLKKHDAL